jgi:hypothetical protein
VITLKKKVDKLKMAFEMSKKDMKSDKGMKESSKKEIAMDKKKHK